MNHRLVRRSVVKKAAVSARRSDSEDFVRDGSAEVLESAHDHRETQASPPDGYESPEQLCRHVQRMGPRFERDDC